MIDVAEIALALLAGIVWIFVMPLRLGRPSAATDPVVHLPIAESLFAGGACTMYMATTA